jgi:hypothetical protein
MNETDHTFPDILCLGCARKYSAKLIPRLEKMKDMEGFSKKSINRLNLPATGTPNPKDNPLVQWLLTKASNMHG